MLLHDNKRASLIVLWLVIAIFALLPGLASPKPVYAEEPSISIKTEIGFDGHYKMGEWTPLKITLTSDTDISGDISVQMEYPYNSSQASYVQRVDLPAGTPKEITFGILGHSFHKDNNSIRFYEDSVETGKFIPFTTKTPYLSSNASSGTLIGVLASDPDSMNFLSMLNSKGKDVKIIPLKPEQLPEDAVLLEGLDTLVINNYTTGNLGTTRIEAIKAWVNQGGTLVLAGGAGYAKTIQGLEDLSPVDYNGLADVVSLKELEKATGKSLPLSAAFPISAVTLKDGARTIIHGEQPFFASWDVSKGAVIYAAYDVSMEPLQSWSGHAELWNKVLQQHASIAPASQANMGWTGNMAQRIDHLLDYFPSLSLPPYSLLLWLLLGYAVVVAPGLYFVLKKLDRREWAWLLIPVIAVIASGGIYLAGTTGKSTLRTNTLSIVELDGKGYADRSTSTALFIPRSGNYQVSFPAGTHVTVQREDGLISGGQSIASNRQLIRKGDSGTEVGLNGMTYRSLAKFSVEQLEDRQFGQVELDISFDDQGMPQGKVTNATSMDLTNTSIVLNDKLYLLGDLAKGETATIQSNPIPVRHNDYGDRIFPYNSNRGENMKLERARGLVNSYFNQNKKTSHYAFIGWSKDQLLEYGVNGKNVADDSLNMLVQRIDPELQKDGQWSIPYGYIQPTIAKTTSSDWGYESSGSVHMSAGEMELEYILPSEVEYSELKMRQNNRGYNLTLAVWNASKGELEPLQWNQGLAELAQPIHQYLVGGTTLRVVITTQDWSGFDLPEIAVKGSSSR
ncbi:hypothetical protein [Paenibacillus lentus]|uniref:Glutamine amidotransferase domain-containing protein n=1 Tax=Paenibacillus lentus TaxID=1338368 RepID=A0A3S8RZG0_9BACL|nr:hypothetical protein [Paenibacillus lentus]AZK48305.1 hypothetical protein EIM92_20750 [Paenibacillus lentus]